MENCRLGACLLFDGGLQFCKNCHFVGHKAFCNSFFLPPWPTVFEKIQNCRLKTFFSPYAQSQFLHNAPRLSAQTSLQFYKKQETVGQTCRFSMFSVAVRPTKSLILRFCRLYLNKINCLYILCQKKWTSYMCKAAGGRCSIADR